MEIIGALPVPRWIVAQAADESAAKEAPVAEKPATAEKGGSSRKRKENEADAAPTDAPKEEAPSRCVGQRRDCART